MEEAYGARYADLYHGHWWWRSREELLVRLLDGLLAPGEAGEVLDFGCGDGLFFPMLRRYGEPWGVEPDEALLNPQGEWRHRIRVDFDVGDPAETQRYGLVLALDVLEHIDQPLPVVAELRRRLRPGGWFVATVPAFQSLWTGHDDMNHHVKRYRMEELERLVRSAGFVVHESRYMFVWLALVKWAVALKERLTGPDTSPPAIPPAALNRTVLGLCRLEQQLLGNTRPPFGSSALVVGRAL